MHDLAVLVLMETRTSGLKADEIVARTPFSRVSKVEAQGLMGGFRREDIVNVEILASNSQSIIKPLLTESKKFIGYSQLYMLILILVPRKNKGNIESQALERSTFLGCFRET